MLIKRREFCSLPLFVPMIDPILNSTSIPVIDTHIHLFDPGRPQGIPWPTKEDGPLYQAALPPRFRKTSAPFHVVGAIEVESSPWFDDNQWILDLAATDDMIVGTVGDLEPDLPEFHAQLERFRRDPLFRGIRYGNLWKRSLAKQLSNPQFIAGIHALADAGMVLDSANPDPELLAAILRLTDKVPSLTIIVDHLPQANPPAEISEAREYQRNLRELSARPQVYVKVSEVLRRVNNHVPLDLDFYKPRLDEIWDLFGEDRLLFGSDWPNSELWGNYGEVIGIVRQYFLAKGTSAAEKYFWKNSIRAYGWMARSPEQRKLLV